MDNGSPTDDNGLSPMCNLHTRIKTFRNTAVIDGKKFRWPYTVIPFEGMAKLGFFYCPFKDSKHGDEVCRDAVQCIFCKQITHDFRECRSKKKDTTETMTNVLRHHLATNKEPCLLSELKLRALQDVSIEYGTMNWEETPVFCDPLGQNATDLRKFTFEMNWDLVGDNLSPQKMSEAGLLRYDSSFTGFEELPEIEVRDACYCIYCKRLVGSWQSNDDPLLEHYKSSDGGNCYFFRTMRSDSHYNDTIQYLQEKFAKAMDTEHRDVEGGTIQAHDSSLSRSMEQEIDIEVEDPPAMESSPMLANENEQLSSPMKSPTRKRRLLRKSTTKRYFEGDTSNASEMGPDEDKDLIVDIKEHVEKARNVGRKNKILDDSSDDFSFSAQGHSTFEIPAIPTRRPTNNFEKVDENAEEHQEPQPDRTVPPRLLNSDTQSGPLNTIPIDYTLSSDTSLKSSVTSTPIHSPQSGIEESILSVKQLPEEVQYLRHLQSRKLY